MPDNEGVVAVSVARRHVCALLREGGVVCWGDGGDGRLGYASTANLGGTSDTTPDKNGRVPLPTGTYAIGVSAGDTFSCALLNTGQVLCWGNTADGRLGYTAAAGVGDTSLEQTSTLPPVNLPDGRTAIALGDGDRMTCAILDSGELFCWGPDAEDDAADGLVQVPGGAQVIATSVGSNHMCALTNNKQVFCWGADHFGQRGASEVNGMPGAVPMPEGTAPVAVTAGAIFTCVILDTQEVLCWGYNEHGELGQRSTLSDTQGLSPATLPRVDLGGVGALALEGGRHAACARLVNGSTLCWGDGDNGGLGNALGGNVGDGRLVGKLLEKRMVPPPPMSGGYKQISIGIDHTCAIFVDDTLRCWGKPTYGMLGYGDYAERGNTIDTIPENLAAIPLPVGSKPTSVATGDRFTCAVMNHASLICWGYNIDGQLGYGNSFNRGLTPSSAPAANLTVSLPAEGAIKSVHTTQEATCVLFVKGTVSCWGSGFFGAHGGSTTLDYGRASFTIPSVIGTVELPTGRTIKTMSGDADGNHFCAILDTDEVLCWGRGWGGALGHGSSSNIGDSLSRAVKDATPLALPGTITQVSCGDAVSCALNSAGAVYCWGYGADGTLRYGSTNNIGTSSALSAPNAVALPGGAVATGVFVGSRHACAVLESGALHCWGNNEYGQLGYAHTDNIGDSTLSLVADTQPVPLPSTAAVRSVHPSREATCVEFADNTMTCWGKPAPHLGWGDPKYMLPLELPNTPSSPPAGVSSRFGPFSLHGTIVGAADPPADDTVTTTAAADDGSTQADDDDAGVGDDVDLTIGGLIGNGGDDDDPTVVDAGASGGGSGGSGNVNVSGDASSLAGGLIAGIIIAAVLMAALMGLIVYKVLIKPAIAVGKAASGAAAAAGAAASDGTVPTVMNPLSRVSGSQA